MCLYSAHSVFERNYGRLHYCWRKRHYNNALFMSQRRHVRIIYEQRFPLDAQFAWSVRSLLLITYYWWRWWSRAVPRNSLNKSAEKCLNNSRCWALCTSKVASPASADSACGLAARSPGFVHSPFRPSAEYSFSPAELRLTMPSRQLNNLFFNLHGIWVLKIKTRNIHVWILKILKRKTTKPKQKR